MSNLILSEAVINWYEKNHRKLPWRPSLGENANPYFTRSVKEPIVFAIFPCFPTNLTENSPRH